MRNAFLTAANLHRLIPAVFVCLFSAAMPGLRAQTPAAAGNASAHTGKAVRLMQSRQYADASVEFEAAVAADPNDDNVRIQYAICLFAAERNDDARRQFEILRQHRGEWPGLQYYLGMLDFRADNFTSAIERLKPLLANPAFPKASFYVGMAYQSLGQDKAARENLERAAKDNPGDPQVHYRLGRLYSLSGLPAEAAREYEQYQKVSASQQLAEQYGSACTEALHTKPIALARLVCNQIADAPIAESNDAVRMTLLGQLYCQAKAFTDAVPPLQKAVELDPSSFEAWNYLGISLYSLRRYSDAVAPLRKAAELNPQYFDTLNMLAATLHDLGDDATALPFLERAHNLNPDDAAVSGALEKMRAAVNGKR